MNALFEVRSDAFFLAPEQAIPLFDNVGTFRKTTTTGATSFQNVAFNNQGTVQVQTGSLILHSGSSSGTFTVAAGAQLEFAKGNHALANANVSGSDTIAFSGGSHTLSGSYSVSTTVVTGGTAAFNQTSTVSFAGLTVAGGNLAGSAPRTVTGNFTWTGGTLTGSGQTTLGPASQTTLGGGNTKTLDSHSLLGDGSVAWTGGGSSMILRNGAVWENRSAGRLEFQADATIDGAGTTPALNNAGTLVVKFPATRVTLAGGLSFGNTGTVQVQNGVLALRSTGSSSGRFEVSAGATLEVASSNYAFTGSATITGLGTANFGTVGVGTVQVAGTYTVTTTTVSGGSVNFNNSAALTLTALNLSGGTLGGSANRTVRNQFVWTGGTLGGTGVTTLTGTSQFGTGSQGKAIDGHTLINNGSVTWTGGAIDFLNGAVLRNEDGATYQAQADAAFTSSDGRNPAS